VRWTTRAGRRTISPVTSDATKMRKEKDGQNKGVPTALSGGGGRPKASIKKKRDAGQKASENPPRTSRMAGEKKVCRHSREQNE